MSIHTLVCLTLFIRLSLGDIDEDLYYSCHDEHHLCKTWAKQGYCMGKYDTAPDHWSSYFYAEVKVNNECRESCKEYFLSKDLTEDEKAFVESISGLRDYHVDQLNVKHEICDLRHGWNSLSRQTLLSNSVLANIMFANDEKMKRYTKEGFLLEKVPEDIWENIQQFYKNGDLPFSSEDIPDYGFSRWPIFEISEDQSFMKPPDPSKTAQIYPMNPDLLEEIATKLLPRAEEWSKIKLKFSVLYGIRRYLRGNKLMSHTDVKETHIISAIVNVGQNVDEPWPLQIKDHQGKVHEVILKPGDLLWYESAKLPHGRAKPLVGKYYDNFFLHYMPREWKKK